MSVSASKLVGPFNEASKNYKIQNQVDWVFKNKNFKYTGGVATGKKKGWLHSTKTYTGPDLRKGISSGIFLKQADTRKSNFFHTTTFF